MSVWGGESLKKKKEQKTSGLSIQEESEKFGTVARNGGFHVILRGGGKELLRNLEGGANEKWVWPGEAR